MKPIISQLTDCIESTFDIGGIDYSKKIILFPCGDIGIQTINILRDIYNIEPAFMVDNNKCKYSDKICDSSIFDIINCEEFVIILCSTNPDIYLSIRRIAKQYFSPERTIELESMTNTMKYNPDSLIRTKIGKYSYGPICINHWYIESIGAFCSFATGVDAVPNHEMNYLSVHPFLSHGMNFIDMELDYESFGKKYEWYFPGVKPKSIVQKRKRSIIGNDVWLGRNVLITNGANIGNGVIAGAGAVITKDIPDYAVVAGTPAKIIRFRYSPQQIDSLNRIAWWDWSDEIIRNRYDDFYLPIEEFIDKYDC